MCVKLSQARDEQESIDQAFQRICIDLCDLSILGKFEFYDGPSSHRLWVWEKDMEKTTRPEFH
jgi:hypothetical protein